MELSAYLKKYRKENHVTQQELADKAGLSKGFISQLENDYRRNASSKKMVPSLDVFKRLAKAMGVDLNSLLSSVDSDIDLSGSYDSVKVSLPHPEPVREIPIYGNICCGNGLFVDDEIVSSISVPVAMLPNKSAEYFAQYAQGDSMTGAGIHDGDLIVFEKTPAIDPGQIGCFCIDENEAVCKKYTVSNHFIVLLPANDKYDPITVDPVSECFKVIGRKVLTISK